MRHLVPTFILEKYSLGEWHGRFSGTALFVDISGFTAITNALMQQGAEGGEIMADVMQAAFDPLVTAVYQHGGFITGFAGDAFTAVFPKTHKSTPLYPILRALAAATQIHQHLQTHPQHATPLGTFTLQARIGVGLGDIMWGIIAGGRQTEAAFYFSGAAIEAATAAEKQSQPGELVISHAFHEQVKWMLTAEQITTASSTPFWRMTAVLPTLPPPQTITLPTPDPHILPIFARQDIVRQTVRGEYRHITTLFMQLQDVHSHQQLTEFVQIIFALQETWGGYLNAIDFGDKGCTLLLFWGMPHSYEDDVSRALNFALQLAEQSEIVFRVGITYRLMYAGFVGTSRWREEYSCYGRGVNLAARLMVHAAWSGILLDEFAAQHANTQFQIVPQEEFVAKGFDAPQPTYALHGRQTAVTPPTTHHTPTTPMVGRQAEMRRLHEFIQPIRNGRYAGVLLIQGEAGIGKTRLITEFGWEVKAQKQANWFITHADQFASKPYHPFRQLLCHYFEQASHQNPLLNKQAFTDKLYHLIAQTTQPDLRRRLEQQQEHLAALLDLSRRDSPLDSHELFGSTITLAVLTAFLQALSLQTPLVLVIENIRWLDELSWQCLRALHQHKGECSLAIVLTTRPYTPQHPFLQEDWLTMLELSPLTSGSLAALATEIIGLPPTPDLLKLLVERSNGNPLFAEQLLYYMQEQGSLESAARFQHTTQLLPPDVRGMLVARLDSLPISLKEVVQTASVLGYEFESRLLLHLLPNDPQAVDKIAAAQKAGVWHAEDGQHLAFSNRLMRDVAYDMQLQSRRRALHQQTADLICQLYADELEGQYEILAYHYKRAGNAAQERDYALLAMGHALQVYDYATAVAHLNRALELTENVADRFDLLCQQHDIQTALRNPAAQQESLDQLEALVHQTENETWLTELRRRQATAAFINGDLAACRGFARQTMALAQAQANPAAQMQALLHFGWLAFYEHDFSQAVVHWHEGQQIAITLSDQASHALTLRWQGMVYYLTQQFEKAQSYYQHSLALYEEISNWQGTADLTEDLGALALARGDLVAAAEYFQQFQAQAEQFDDQRRLSAAWCHRGYLAYWQDDCEHSKSYFQQAISLAEQAKQADLHAQALAMSSIVYYANDDADRAWQLARDSLKIVQSQPLFFESIALVALMTIAWLRAQGGSRFDAALLTSMALRQPLLIPQVRDHTAQPLYDRLARKMPPTEFATAVQQGEGLSVAAVVSQVLADSFNISDNSPQLNLVASGEWQVASGA